MGGGITAFEDYIKKNGGAAKAGEGPDYDKEADDFLKGIYSGKGLDDPRDPGRTIYEGGILVGKTRLKGGQAISYIQQQLIRAGLLDPEDITHPGSAADDATRAAMSMARDAQGQIGTGSVLETLEVLQSQFPGWDKLKKGAREQEAPPYLPGERVKQSAKDVKSIVRTVAQELMGQDASEADVNRILKKVRAGEQTEYEGREAQQRAQYDVSLTEGEGETAEVGGGVVQQAPSAGAIAEEHFLQSEEGLQWGVGKGILALLQEMRSGG